MDAPVRRLRLLMAVLTLLGGALAGCDSIVFGGCEVRLVEVTGPVAWSFEGRTTQGDFFDRLAETNLSPGVFDPIADALEDAASRGGRLSWLVRAFDTIPGWVGVRIGVPVRVGDRIPVAGASPVGGFDLGPGGVDGAEVDVRLGDFRATDARGELVVLRTSPLRVRIELVASDAAPGTLTLEGEMRFRVFEEARRCD